MYCPEGYHFIHELEVMAEEIVDTLHPYLLPNQDLKLPDNENLANLNDYNAEWAKSQKLLLANIVDVFLANVEGIWICSKKGQVLKFSKKVLLPHPDYDIEMEDYLERREAEYDSIDLNYWVLDWEKYQESIDFLSNLFPSGNPNQRITIYPCDLEKFDGWSLCIKGTDFPKSAAQLQKFYESYTTIADVDARKGRPPNRLELALSLLSKHYPEGTGSSTVKEVLREMNGVGFFSGKTLARAMKIYNENLDKIDGQN